MKIEELHGQEFEVLKHVHDGFTPNPDQSAAFIALDNEEIVGRIFLMCPTHIEGPWIRDDKRCGTLASRLIKSVEERAKSIGIRTLFAYAVDSRIEDYLQRLGYNAVPMTVWSKEL